MASITQSSAQTADLLQKLSLDPQDKPLQAAKPTKKGSAVIKYGVDSPMHGFSKPFERTASPHPDIMNPSMFYSSSGGFNGFSVGDWDHYGSTNGVEIPPGIYGDYQNSYSYAPYGTYSSPGCTISPDTTLYGPQNFQYPTCYFQPSAASHGTYMPNGVNTAQYYSASLAAESVQLPTVTAKGNHNFASNDSGHSNDMSNSFRPNYLNPNLKSNDFYGWGGDLSSVGSVNSSTFSYGHNYSPVRNQNLGPLPHIMGMQQPAVGVSGVDRTGITNRVYPSPSSRMYSQYPNISRRGAGYFSSGYEPRTNGHEWLAVDYRYRSKHRWNSLVSGNESVRDSNEVNKGPRARGFKDEKDSESTTLAVGSLTVTLTERSGEDNSNQCIDREQYNRDDFPELYSEAKFFVIKSYSEDDVHKSIKYGVWTSTPNGNKKLDAAFKEAQEKEKSGGCPVFLLFSVNASGGFVGLAEMTGPVDFDQSVEHWQQDKWTGCFPVKWHLAKDVPNRVLRHITLENNENKPVTNSRDTQEVRLEQGNEIVKLMKTYSSRSCILDDFEFYERREKEMQEKKTKQRQFNKQVGDAVVLSSVKHELVSKQAAETSSDSISSPLTEESTASKAT